MTAVVETKQTRNINFQLLYNIKDAGWYPTYDVRINDVTDPLDVLMNANVFQRSGETWKDVALLLSTGNPGDNATPIELQPWLLNYYDPSLSFRQNNQQGAISGRVTDEKAEPIAGATIIVQNTKLATVTDANGFFKLQNISQGSILKISSIGYQPKQIAAKYGYFSIVLKAASEQLNEVVVLGYSALQGQAAGVEVEDKEPVKKNKDVMQTVSVTTQYQPTTTVYKIEDRYTLETDGKTTTIGIKQFTVPALFDYFTAPKIDPSAFLTAKVINWQDYDFQSGEAILYFEGSFLGKTYIDLSTTEDTLSLSLGKDNSIKVARKLVKEFSSKRLIGNNRTESKHYEISIRNNKRVPVIVRLADQFPVSVNKDISVEDVKAPEALIDKNSGMVMWMINLPPGQEKKVTINYNVKYPKDRKVLLE